MKYVKWIFVGLFIFLVSFVDKDSIFSGQSVGDKAPDFVLPAATEGDSTLNLRALQGDYVLLCFWATYDAASRARNVELNRAVSKLEKPVKMVSVSFDEYRSVFKETIKSDKIESAICRVDVDGEESDIYKLYRLKRGFKNFLINPEGIIIAKNIDSDELREKL